MKERVDGHQNILKDIDTGVIINKSNTERERYRTAKQHALDSIKSKEEIDTLRRELDDVKHLLKQILR